MATIPMNQTIKCPYCEEFVSAPFYSTINASLEPDLKERILNGTLFSVKCPHCGRTLPLSYNCIYQDLLQGLFLMLTPAGAPSRMPELAADLEKSKQFADARELAYTLREVSNPNEMLDKIKVFDSLLDDRIVELVKLFAAGNLMKSPEFAALDELYFDAIENENMYFACILQDGTQRRAALPFAAYGEFCSLFMDAVNAGDKDGFYRYDTDWAAGVLGAKQK